MASELGIVASGSSTSSNTVVLTMTSNVAAGDETTAVHLLIVVSQKIGSGDLSLRGDPVISDDAPLSSPYELPNEWVGAEMGMAGSVGGSDQDTANVYAWLVLSDLSIGDQITVSYPSYTDTMVCLDAVAHEVTGLQWDTPTGPPADAGTGLIDLATNNAYISGCGGGLGAKYIGCNPYTSGVVYAGFVMLCAETVENPVVTQIFFDAPLFAGGSDSWTAAGNTWTYVSAFKFRITGVNLTATYTPGTKLRLKQGGAYQYYFVVSSAFTGGNTDVTISHLVGDSGPNLANAAITDNDYSHNASPTGYTAVGLTDYQLIGPASPHKANWQYCFRTFDSPYPQTSPEAREHGYGVGATTGTTQSMFYATFHDGPGKPLPVTPPASPALVSIVHTFGAN